MIRELVGTISRALVDKAAQRLDALGVREGVQAAREHLATLIDPRSSDDERDAAREALNALAERIAERR